MTEYPPPGNMVGILPWDTIGYIRAYKLARRNRLDLPTSVYFAYKARKFPNWLALLVLNKVK